MINAVTDLPFGQLPPDLELWPRAAELMIAALAEVGVVARSYMVGDDVHVTIDEISKYRNIPAKVCKAEALAWCSVGRPAHPMRCHGHVMGPGRCMLVPAKALMVQPRTICDLVPGGAVWDPVTGVSGKEVRRGLGAAG